MVSTSASLWRCLSSPQFRVNWLRSLSFRGAKQHVYVFVGSIWHQKLVNFGCEAGVLGHMDALPRYPKVRELPARLPIVYCFLCFLVNHRMFCTFFTFRCDVFVDIHWRLASLNYNNYILIIDKRNNYGITWQSHKWARQLKRPVVAPSFKRSCADTDTDSFLILETELDPTSSWRKNQLLGTWRPEGKGVRWSYMIYQCEFHSLVGWLETYCIAMCRYQQLSQVVDNVG